MAEQLRSATVLVDKALSDPKTIQDLKADPVGTLRALESKVTQELPPPGPGARNVIWITIVFAFALVLMYSVWILGVGVTSELKENVLYATKSDTMLTVVTTVVGFLAGLLSPSPVSKSGA